MLHIYPKTALPFDDHHPHLIHPSLDRPHSPPHTASGSSQPFCHSTLCWNTTSPTKPEVYNVSQRRQRRTEPRPQATCIKFGEIRLCGFWVMSADAQTDRHTHYKTRGRSSNAIVFTVYKLQRKAVTTKYPTYHSEASLIRFVNVFWSLQLHLKSFHANLKSIHRLYSRMSARRIVKTHKTCQLCHKHYWLVRNRINSAVQIDNKSENFQSAS